MGRWGEAWGGGGSRGGGVDGVDAVVSVCTAHNGAVAITRGVALTLRRLPALIAVVVTAETTIPILNSKKVEALAQVATEAGSHL